MNPSGDADGSGQGNGFEPPRAPSAGEPNTPTGIPPEPWPAESAPASQPNPQPPASGGTEPPQPQSSVPAVPPKTHPLIVLQPGERVICDIKRHPFGILTMYFGGAFAIVVALVAAFFVPQFIGQLGGDTHNLSLLAYLILAVWVLGVGAALAIASYVYWRNEWIVTDDSITQVSQTSLISQQTSQLSMANIEDVTVEQQGLFPTMLNFGTLKVETAGERSKFSFSYCPSPNDTARAILAAREDFMNNKHYQGGGQ